MREPEDLNDTKEKLKKILEMACEQRSLLDRGDLEAVQALQASRQRLLPGVQSLDGADGETKSMVSEIRKTDQSLRLLLSSELTDIERKMRKIASLRKLFHARRPARKGSPRYVSRRI